MKSRYKWENIKSYITQAQENGHITLQLPTPKDAELFTFAFYNYRRNRKHGRELQITRDSNIVIISKTIEMYIKPLP